MKTDSISTYESALRVLNKCTDIDHEGKALVRRYLNDPNALTQEERDKANGIIVSHDELEAVVEKYEAPIRTLAHAGFAFTPLSDILARPVVKPEWIVADFIAAKGNGHRAFKGELIAKSKQHKTFFALQFALCLATGRDFLGFKIPEPRKILYVNNELPDTFLNERLRCQCGGLGIDLANPRINNLRIACPTAPYGVRTSDDTEREFITQIKETGIEVIIFDPVYKMLQPGEEENSGIGIGGLLRFRDRIVTESNAAVLYVHHDGKSQTDGRDITDRGSGSGFLGRDYDFRLTLDPHADGDESHAVLNGSCRVRKSPPDVTIVFDEESLIFTIDNTISAYKASLQSKRGKRISAEKCAEVIQLNDKAKEVAIAIAEEHGCQLLSTTTFKNEMRRMIGKGVNEIDRQLKILLEKGVVLEACEMKRKSDGTVSRKQHGDTFVSIPKFINEYVSRFAQN